ncbi:prepilin-type N-terminal cleavage/methylation domain-containing protein [Acinetobacter sp. YH16042]|uniref:pilin n=1 Tax=Acinetobacter sp. YH16042 TaxID=2601186 RepID=UPI0015D3B84C|nr:prepilin-type N-terminal cleavage/methylation domain-containing protein [Acinetobacter sp. YH16042]
MHKIKEFALIEILIVVAIIGILILFALVQYNRHMTKKMLEVIGAARIAQLAVTEATISEKDLTVVTASNIGYQFSNNSHKYIK